MQKQSTTDIREKKSTFSSIESQHPYMMMLYLGIVGIFLAFSLLMLLFLKESVNKSVTHPIDFPLMFFISTGLILLSSFYVEKARQEFYRDNFKMLSRYLGITLVLGLGFLVTQVIGGFELHQNAVYLDGTLAGSYLYLISALHMIHLVGGLMYAAYLFRQYKKKSESSVSVLIAVTNPYEKIKLQLLITYWHFMDVLWVVIAAGFFLALL